jgi:hypothetical protein
MSIGNDLKILELHVYDYISGIKHTNLENGKKRRSRKASKVSRNMVDSNKKDSDSI